MPCGSRLSSPSAWRSFPPRRDCCRQLGARLRLRRIRIDHRLFVFALRERQNDVDLLPISLGGHFLIPTTPRHPTDWGPTTPRPVALLPRPVFVVGGGLRVDCRTVGQCARIQQTKEEPSAILASPVVEQLVKKSLHVAGVPVHGQIFHIRQAAQMDFELGIAPAGPLPHIPAAKKKTARFHGPLGTFAPHLCFQEPEQPPCLWGQLVQAPAQHFMGNAVGCGDVFLLDLDILRALGQRLDFALVLVEQGNGADERRVLMAEVPS